MVTAGTAATAIRQRSAAGLSFLACDGREGTPVVLLHGIGSNAQSFVPLMQAFDRRSAVLAWDAPGYGDSQPLALDWPDAAGPRAKVEEELAELDAAGNDPPRRAEELGDLLFSVVNLARHLGAPAIWRHDDFAAVARYACFIGAKRVRDGWR